MKVKRLKLLAVSLFIPLLLGLMLLTAVSPQTAHALGPYIVNNLGDDSDADTGDGMCSTAGAVCTLRAATEQANADAIATTIRFDISGQIILGSELIIASDMTIDGGNVITVSGNNAVRVFHVTASHVTLAGLTIRNGRSPSGESGGGIYNNGSLMLTNSTLSGNAAGDGVDGVNGADGAAGVDGGFGVYGGSGGGIYNSGSLTLTNSTLSDNTTGSGGWGGNGGSGGDGGHGGLGGGIYNSGSLTLTNSTLSGNITGVGGDGGLGTYDGSHGIGGLGGGIYSEYGYLTLTNITNSTISDNTAGGDGQGGGIVSDPGMIMKNSIVANNSAAVSPDCLSPDPFLGHYNLIKDITGCTFTPDSTNIIGGDPLLEPLQDNGGPTLTQQPASGSPVIDKIPNANCTNTPINGIDQRGAVRNFDGDGSASGNECDIGAVEYHPIAENCTLGTDLTIDNIIFNISNMGTLACIKVEDMGAVDHLLATTGIQTGRWWHIYGEDNGGNRVTNGFNLTMTFPFAGANTSTRLCKYPGNLGGDGWNCDDGTNTSYGTDTVTRSNVEGFSDWAVGNNVGPTAVSLQSIAATSNAALLPILIATLLLLLMGGVVLRRRAG